MAGDWIKMRGNLWDDPRVARLCDLTDQTEASVIGGLYWLWASADQHTEDGDMPGLSLRQIDRKTGVPGLGAALVTIGWLRDDEHGVVLANFHEHNGASAKKRCQTAKRVAAHKAGNAAGNEEREEGNAVSVSSALPREREEKEKNSIPSEAKASGAEAPPADTPGGVEPVPADPAEVIFGLGVPLLTAAGVSERNARSMLGLMRKTHGDEAVAAAIGRCSIEKPLEPVAWLQAAIKPRGKASKHTGFDDKDYRAGVTADGFIA